MSKIQIEQIDSVTTNGNLQLTPNGTGIVDVSGDSDGILQLDDVKVKAPSATAQQNTTLILPQNDVTATEYLEVNSITGSGSTAVGQLASVNVPPLTTNNLDGANFTTGTVPSARYSIPGTAGGGLQLVSKQEVTSTGTVSTIDFPLEANTSYKVIGKNIEWSADTYFVIDWLGANGNHQGTHIRYANWYGPNYPGYYTSQTYGSEIYFFAHNSNHKRKHGFEFHIENTPAFVSMDGWLHNLGHEYSFGKLNAGYAYNQTSLRIHTLRFSAYSGYAATFEPPSTILLYKYN